MSKQGNKEKIRVYEYAKSLNMSSKEIITILKRVNMPVNNHMSVMEPEMIERVEQFFRDIKASAEAKRAGAETAQKKESRSAAQEQRSKPLRSRPATRRRQMKQRIKRRKQPDPSPSPRDGQLKIGSPMRRANGKPNRRHSSRSGSSAAVRDKAEAAKPQRIRPTAAKRRLPEQRLMPLRIRVI